MTDNLSTISALRTAKQNLYPIVNTYYIINDLLKNLENKNYIQSNTNPED